MKYPANWEGLARNLCTAFIAHQQGVTMATMEKRFKGHPPPGPYWMALANQVAHEALNAMEAGLKEAAAAKTAIGMDRRRGARRVGIDPHIDWSEDRRGGDRRRTQ